MQAKLSSVGTLQPRSTGWVSPPLPGSGPIGPTPWTAGSMADGTTREGSGELSTWVKRVSHVYSNFLRGFVRAPGLPRNSPTSWWMTKMSTRPSSPGRFQEIGTVLDKAGTAEMSGTFAVPGHHRSLAALRTQFRTKALGLGLDDLDTAAIRDTRPRALTRGISAWLYRVGDEQLDRLDGIEFSSRHGDDLKLWAIYERGSDTDISAQLTLQTDDAAINPEDPQLARAMELLGLRWAD